MHLPDSRGSMSQSYVLTRFTRQAGIRLMYLQDAQDRQESELHTYQIHKVGRSPSLQVHKFLLNTGSVPVDYCHTYSLDCILYKTSDLYYPGIVLMGRSLMQTFHY